MGLLRCDCSWLAPTEPGGKWVMDATNPHCPTHGERTPIYDGLLAQLRALDTDERKNR